MAETVELADELASLSLFADLSRPEVEAAARIFGEVWYGEGERIIREGLSGTGFFVVLEGEVAVRANGRDTATLGRGSFIGEVSALLGEVPSADVVALRRTRCLQLAGPALHDFLIAHPAITYRMLLEQTRRLRATTRARG
jgi:CRP-like cAMP-binding protein